MNKDRWRIWCETEDSWVYEFLDEDAGTPTECPNNPAHTIDVAKGGILESIPGIQVITDPVMEPVIPGSSKVVANDRPAIEVQNGVTGWAAVQAIWPRHQTADAKVRACIRFILKAVNTGSNVRISFRIKAEGTGDDSSEAFPQTGFATVPITYTTIGEVFCGNVTLDADAFEKGDAVALQVGRDGNNELSGSGSDDDVDVAVQIIGVEVEAY
jgi:hypothetical protein